MKIRGCVSDWFVGYMDALVGRPMIFLGDPQTDTEYSRGYQDGLDLRSKNGQGHQVPKDA